MTKNKHWYKIILQFAAKADVVTLDMVTALFNEYGSLGSQVEYAEDYHSSHPNLFGEIPEQVPDEIAHKPSQVTAYYEPDFDASALKQELAQVLVGQTYTLIEGVEVDQDWQQAWQSFYQVEHLSRYLSIVPSWLDGYEPTAGEHIIKLEPGLSFGTGQHPTTRLSAQGLEIYLRPGDRVIDVGTGSGILALVAASLGASQVLGLDLDPQAVAAAQHNLQLPGHNLELVNLRKQGLINFQVNNLLEGLVQEADIIVANILPYILVDMLEDAKQILTNQGYLILGGIMTDQGPELEEHLAKADITIIQKIQAGQWLGYVTQPNRN